MNNRNEYYQFGPFAFDVDKAIDIIRNTPGRPLHRVNVKELSSILRLDKSDAELMKELKTTGHASFSLLRGNVDEEYAKTEAELSVPLIFVDLSSPSDGDPAHLMIDGTHRVRRAVIEGVTTLPSYLLTHEETLQIRSEAYYR